MIPVVFIGDNTIKNFENIELTRRALEKIKLLKDENKKNTIKADILIQNKLEAIMKGDYDINKFNIGKYGKPYYDSNKAVHFNISHTGNIVVVVFYICEIGVDVEYIENEYSLDYQRDIMDFFNTREIEYLSSSLEFNFDFIKLWTAKESFVKYTGSGLYRELSSFFVDLKSNLVYVQKK
ncbi:4'-phosphopantetheinyl transferase superfamily protein [Streptococcus equinus]|uniref:4'-phosphopantetheinyl transferase family protein n=1 Tax=Streptococcus equinus TaxID=1335 RepID=UPI00106F33C7|nr:4'-phosphopantetheinyl transferase superfamily protein [Streptococcus equinus]TFH45333.1 4'-phosphopantetheinyl transferase superfamily protein [Streptococcus equinus]